MDTIASLCAVCSKPVDINQSHAVTECPACDEAVLMHWPCFRVTRTNGKGYIEFSCSPVHGHWVRETVQ
jgi:predicted RNA-binding Zn-ribbon protein involved in translation (DUF1610 family)